jgi:hypothetical protein
VFYVDATAAFYRDVLGLPLELERHRGTERHWAGQVGGVHFAIHERETFWLGTAAVVEPPGTIVSFTVEDLDASPRSCRRAACPSWRSRRWAPCPWRCGIPTDGTCAAARPWPGSPRAG